MILQLRIAAAVAVLVALGFSHNRAYQLGADSTKLVYLEQAQEHNKALLNKIDVLEQAVFNLAQVSEATQNSMQGDISAILAGVKKKPVTIVKEGKCTPSESFAEGISQAISRANQK